MGKGTGLNDENRNSAIALLKPLLADEYVLYTKTRNYHWNVTGPHFHDLHKFFETQYEAVDEKIDEIAEFIRSLGDAAPGTMKAFLDGARLQEASDEKLKASEMVKDLRKNHEAICRQLRDDIRKAGDEYGADDVADFLTGLLEDHQKMAWMLRATEE
jgi:starvation-inducible DNA-binding protein